MTRLVWYKRRWRCPSEDCGVGVVSEQDAEIAPPREKLTTRASRCGLPLVGLTVSLCGLCELCLLVVLPLGGGLVVEGWVDSVGVVAADPGEDGLAGLVSGDEPHLGDEFSFGRREEGFGDAVVRAVPDSSDRVLDAAAGQCRGELG